MGKKRITGGRRLKAWVQKAEKNARKPQIVEIGFFPSARYADGKREFVATIAAMHEFGLDDLPERAFLRRSVPEAAPQIRGLIRDGLRGRSLDQPLALPSSVAREAGEAIADRMRRNIDTLRQPPNDPDTIARKGSANPLRDSDRMRDAVAVRLPGEGLEP